MSVPSRMRQTRIDKRAVQGLKFPFFIYFNTTYASLLSKKMFYIGGTREGMIFQVIRSRNLLTRREFLSALAIAAQVSLL